MGNRYVQVGMYCWWNRCRAFAWCQQPLVGSGCGLNGNGSNETISPASQGLDKTRIRCRVPERLTDLVDRGVQAVVEINKGVSLPDFFAKLIAADDLSGSLEKRGENLERLLLKSYPIALLAELAGKQVDFEQAEAQKSGSGGWPGCGHRERKAVYRSGGTGDHGLVVSHKSPNMPGSTMVWCPWIQAEKQVIPRRTSAVPRRSACSSLSSRLNHYGGSLLGRHSLERVVVVSSDPMLVVILGPTGSGKTALSLSLAQHFAGEIVNCDSVAMYREFEIGTAKPTAEERAQAPHHLLDFVEPTAYITAGEYARRARQTLNEIKQRGMLPIVVGGTGLYLRALLDGLFPGPQRSEELREKLRKRALARGP